MRWLDRRQYRHLLLGYTDRFPTDIISRRRLLRS
jgi:hypothetical protein